MRKYSISDDVFVRRKIPVQKQKNKPVEIAAESRRWPRRKNLHENEIFAAVRQK